MAFVPGYKTRVLAGSLHISGSIRNASVTVPRGVIDVSVLTSGANKDFILGNKGDGSFQCDGPLDMATSSNAPYTMMTGWKGTNVPISYFPSGATAALDECWILDGIQTEFGVTGNQEGSVDFSLSAAGTGAAPAGILIEPLAAVTTTTTGTARDDVAASTNGGVFHLHVTSWTTLTSNTVTVEDSADGTTGWAVIATFAAATGVTSQRVQTTGAIKRWVRVKDTVAGSGSCTRAVAYARL